MFTAAKPGSLKIWCAISEEIILREEMDDDHLEISASSSVLELALASGLKCLIYFFRYFNFFLSEIVAIHLPK